MTFPVELRERVVHAVLEGGRAYAEVAGEFGVSEPSFKRWVGKHRRVESLESKIYKLGCKKILDDADLRVLRDMVEAEPNISVETLTRDPRRATRKAFKTSTLVRALRRLGFTKRRPVNDGPRVEPPRDPNTRYEEHHRRSTRSGRYPSSETDVEWALLRPVFAPEGPGGRGRPRRHPQRELLDALFYVVRTGCAWRMLPREFPPWETVYAAFRSWGRQGKFASMHRELHGLWRERLGRASMPSAVIVDSQSTKTTETGGLAAMTSQRRL